MDESNRFDELSTEEFRGLQEAPLTAENQDTSGAANRADDPDLNMEATRESDIDADILEADLDEALIDEDDISTEMSRPGFDVILQSDISGEEDGINSIHSPDMFAPDTPGQIDIEDLPDDALDGTDLPEDARLDPLEP